MKFSPSKGEPPIKLDSKFLKKSIFLLDLIRELVYYYNQIIGKHIKEDKEYVDRRAEEKD